MPGYRIYWLDQADHITEADGLIADFERNRTPRRERAYRNGLGD